MKKLFAPFLVSGFFLVILFMFASRANLENVQASTSATINVNTTADVLANDGFCSLREAVIAANTNTASGAASGECPAGTAVDTINLPAGTYTLTLYSGYTETPQVNDLDITSAVNIVGAGGTSTIINANHIDRAIEISTTGTSTISDLWIEGGQDNGFGGGGVSNDGTLSLDHVVIIASHSSVIGGGFQNSTTGKATLSYVSFATDSAYNGACIYNYGVITITHSSLDFGTSDTYGGGLSNVGYITIYDTNISANTTGLDGGGIYNSGYITLTRVTINDNITNNGNGAGMWSDGTVTIKNTTFSGNSAKNGGLGGGFYKGGGNGTMTNVTIANNSAALGGGIDDTTTGLSLKNTLLANNTGGNCRTDTGKMASLGYNLSDDNTCNLALNQSGDQNNVLDAKIGPLANNGGATETHALLTGSPAIDHGTNAGCPGIDQRSYHRPVDGDQDGTATCDVGSYERWVILYLPAIYR